MSAGGVCTCGWVTSDGVCGIERGGVGIRG